MTQPVANAAATATNTDVSAAKENVIEGATEHTPDVPEHKPPAEVVPDPVEGGHAKDEAAGLLAALGSRVETLESALTEVTKKIDPDKQVNKRVPWTMRGGRKNKR